MKKLLIIIIGTLILSTQMLLASTKIGDLYYNLSNTDKTASVTYDVLYSTNNYNYLTNVVIPQSVTYNNITYTVTTIANNAFRQAGIISVTIPNTITKIGEYAFYSCDDLSTVIMGSGVTRIEQYAFAYCKKLTSFTCTAATPPDCVLGAFNSTPISSVSLYVPSEYVTAYQTASKWRDFKIVQAIPKYTITWKNWDGTTLATTSVLKGATPSYTGSTPTRPSTAEYAYTFSGWTPAITAATANKTYTATYTSTPRYTITFNANGGLIPTNGNMGNTPSGHITTLSTDRTSGTVVVTKDKSHFQTMTNDCPSRAGYTFAGWYTDPTSGVQVYDNTGYRVVGTYWNSEGKWIGTSNVTLYAHWTPIPYTITVNSSNVSQGSASGGGTYDYGTKHQITATPNECYRFVQWSDSNTENPRTITVTEDATYTAIFEKIPYIITVRADDGLKGDVDGAVQ